MRLLLVDDELEFLELMQNRLTRRGFQVTTVANGADALNILQGQNFDAAVIDVKMPGMDGITLLGHIKENFPTISILMLTGHASVDVAQASMKKGAAGYMLKPVAIDELISQITNIVAKNEGKGK